MNELTSILTEWRNAKNSRNIQWDHDFPAVAIKRTTGVFRKRQETKIFYGKTMHEAELAACVAIGALGWS